MCEEDRQRWRSESSESAVDYNETEQVLIARGSRSRTGGAGGSCPQLGMRRSESLLNFSVPLKEGRYNG